MCTHDNHQKQIKYVSPPTLCKPFTIKYNECVDCGRMFATTKQRRKNRQNLNRAYKMYAVDNSSHGIYL